MGPGPCHRKLGSWTTPAIVSRARLETAMSIPRASAAHEPAEPLKATRTRWTFAGPCSVAREAVWWTSWICIAITYAEGSGLAQTSLPARSSLVKTIFIRYVCWRVSDRHADALPGTHALARLPDDLRRRARQ